MRYLFCHILAMKTVAMEKETQWSWHCEHRHSSSSDNYGFSPERLQFPRRQYKQTGRWREKHVKHAHSNFNQPGRPWGWLTKWQKKTSSLLKRHVSLQSPWHDQRKTGGGRGLFIYVVRWTCSAPTESHLCLGRWTCPSRQCIYCCAECTSKWPQDPANLHQQSL